MSALPARQRAILGRLPALEVDRQGNMLHRPASGRAAPLEVAQTQWNREHANDWDRLESGHPWALVLHWYGDSPGFEQSTAAYLRGFDGLRMVSGYETRTSAHCLVGPARQEDAQGGISILQTQVPHADGTPLVASHLQGLDYASHAAREQYFVRALYQLSYLEPTVHSILQDWFDGPRVDPNMRSLAVELCGRDFDLAASYPPDQQIANALAVSEALMRRYQIPGSNLLGHLEIQTSKPDPGKKFMALMRCLLGALALTTNDVTLKELLFARHLGTHNDPWRAVRTYFQFGRDYLLLTGRPVQVYEWEAESGYWLLADRLSGAVHTPLPAAAHFLPPLPGAQPVVGAVFTNPHNHAGVDFYLPASRAGESMPVVLTAPGQCLHTAQVRNHHPGSYQAIFRHRQADGAEVLSLYANLSSLAPLQLGPLYPAGQPVGELRVDAARTFILHFGLAYGATWETDLHNNADIPLNASVTWIRQRFIDPLPYLEARE